MCSLCKKTKCRQELLSSSALDISARETNLFWETKNFVLCYLSTEIDVLALLLRPDFTGLLCVGTINATVDQATLENSVESSTNGGLSQSLGMTGDLQLRVLKTFYRLLQSVLCQLTTILPRFSSPFVRNVSTVFLSSENCNLQPLRFYHCEFLVQSLW